MSRSASFKRRTRETEIFASVDLDGSGIHDVETPIGFFSHMLESFAKHGMFDVHLRAKGDLQVDQHHLVEDCGIVLGRVFNKALGDKRGINRAGYFVYSLCHLPYRQSYDNIITVEEEDISKLKKN